jgi:YHS domain-containing protein
MTENCLPDAGRRVAAKPDRARSKERPSVVSMTWREIAMAKDPVCGMQVDEKKAAATSNYKGTTYYFCAAACKATFEKSPEKFTGRGGTHA